MSSLGRQRTISAALEPSTPLIPPVPARPTNGTSTIKPAASGIPPPAPAPIPIPVPVAETDDPYGQLGDLDLMSGGGGAYQTDIPRPRRGQEDDLLF